jgi:hypothetical protein
MLVVHAVDSAEVIRPFADCPASLSLTPPQWQAYCGRRGLLALVAEEDGELGGFAVAGSGPQAVDVVNLQGTPDACRLLLGRLVRLAGERDVTGRFPARTDLRETLGRLGFASRAAGEYRGRPSRLYHLSRNAG